MHLDEITSLSVKIAESHLSNYYEKGHGGFHLETDGREMGQTERTGRGMHRGGGKFGFGRVILLKQGSDMLYRQQNV